MSRTLEQQLDALIAEHRLSSLNLTRIVGGDGTSFWAIYAQGDGQCGSNVGTRVSAAAAITDAIEQLNAHRIAPVVVPELAEAA